MAHSSYKCGVLSAVVGRMTGRCIGSSGGKSALSPGGLAVNVKSKGRSQARSGRVGEGADFVRVCYAELDVFDPTPLHGRV